MRALFGGTRLALSWLTVLPVRGPAHVDRAAGARAISATPLVGIGLGVLIAGVMWGLLQRGLDPALAGFASVAAHTLLTRGMHIDGLADTADGLGCYGPPERAREIMRSGTVGPFGVAAIVSTVGIEATALGSLGASHMWWGIIVGAAGSRVAVVLACNHKFAAATASGFGALVAGSQPPWRIAAWVSIVVGASVWAVPGAPWAGPTVTIVALGAATLFVRHCVRRFGGLTGDVLGAVIELTTVICFGGYLVAA